MKQEFSTFYILFVKTNDPQKTHVESIDFP